MDSAQAETLYQRYFDTLYRVCFLYMKNEADSLDAVQETFLRLIRSGFKEESEEKTKAWLIVTASNYCKKQLSHWWRKKRSPMEDEEYRLANAQAPSDSGVMELIWSLPEKYRALVYLYYYEGYKTREIAGLLGINASTVQTRLAKARSLLKLELTEPEAGGAELKNYADCQRKPG